jgi:hypothetical protein
MVSRLVLACAIFITASVATATEMKRAVAQQVHPSGICWEPDVEFPVPCDDEED